MDTRGQIVLARFGLGARALSEARQSLTALDPRYSAPEQLSSGVFSTQTDVYALAACLFEGLSGRPLPPTSARGRGIPLPAVPIHTPPALVQALLLALELQPSKRAASARAVLEELDAAPPKRVTIPMPSPIPVSVPAASKRVPIPIPLMVGISAIWAVLGTGSAVWVSLNRVSSEINRSKIDSQPVVIPEAETTTTLPELSPPETLSSPPTAAQPASTANSAAPSSTTSVAPATSEPSSPVYLQVGAFDSGDSAQRLVGMLSDIGYDSSIQAPEGKKMSVLIGPFSGDAVLRAESKLNDNGFDHFRVR